MPYKSQSQRRLFHAKEARGEISKKTVKEFDKKSKGKDLPEKVKNKDEAYSAMKGKMDWGWDSSSASDKGKSKGKY